MPPHAGVQLFHGCGNLHNMPAASCPKTERDEVAVYLTGSGRAVGVTLTPDLHFHGLCALSSGARVSADFGGTGGMKIMTRIYRG